MDLYLIKHGESTQDTRENYEKGLPAPLVSLTDKGSRQCEEAGLFLKNYLKENDIDIQNAVMWVSPFLRTRQTAHIINSFLNIDDVREDYALDDLDYGLFSYSSDRRNSMLFKKEFDHYDNYCQNGCEFYAMTPQGESPMGIAFGTRQFLSEVNFEGKGPLFVISHETTIRTIVMNTFHYSPKWYAEESPMENCSIRLINKDDKIDKFIYGGKVKRLRK